jgi:molybdopterin-containing oxidoreductase family membrane subunit
MAATAPPKLTDAWRSINRDILGALGKPSLGYVALVGLVVLWVILGAVAFTYQTYWGLGVAGYAPPVMWAVYITNRVLRYHRTPGR